MTNHTPGFTFVHGAWHNANAWTTVISSLRTRGFVAEALNLPGADADAKHPVAYSRRPLDPATFATELSPNAGVTQEERTAAVIALVERVAAQTGGQVILVGHSMGGVTATSVAEARPELLAAVVYLGAFLLSDGVAAIEIIQAPFMAGALTPSLFMGDPGAIGALRIDPMSTDPEYATRLKQTFYGHTEDATYASAAAQMLPDEPLATGTHLSIMTPERFGRVPRHYIHTTKDRAILLAGQEYMIARVDATMPTRTVVHTLHSDHSPFASQPDTLVEVLVNISKQSVARAVTAQESN